MSKGFLTSHGVIVAALSLSLVGCEAAQVGSLLPDFGDVPASRATAS